MYLFFTVFELCTDDVKDWTVFERFVITIHMFQMLLASEYIIGALCMLTLKVRKIIWCFVFIVISVSALYHNRISCEKQLISITVREMYAGSEKCLVML